MLISSSPNWYASAVLTSISDKQFVFASRTSLFSYLFDDESGIHHGFRIIAHREKCSTVSKINAHCVVSGGDDHLLKVWHIDEEKFSLKNVYNDHQNPVCALDSNSCFIVSGDTKSMVLIHNLTEGGISKFRPQDQHNSVQVIRIDPTSERCAIGFGFGIIYIYSLAQAGSTKLRGHDGDIQSFLWLRENLISTAKDKTIKVWSIEGSKCIYNLKLPKASGYKAKRGTEDAQRSWVSLCSTEDDSGNFISSGNGGDIILWRFSDAGVKPTFDIFCDNQTDLTHQRVVFGLVTCGRDRLISVSMDREIKVWDMIIRKPKFGLVSSGGFVYSSGISTVDPNFLAFGIGDGMLRVWNQSVKPNHIQTIWQGVKEKVTALAWHSKELRIGFGTEHGKVGVWCASNNKVLNSPKYHSKIVYAVAFLENDMFSCAGDGNIIKHTENMTAGKNLNTESGGKFSAVTVSVDSELIGLGYDSGKIEILNGSSLQKSQDFSDIHSKYITVMKFSKSFFASASNSGSLVIHQISDFEKYRRFAGHCERISCLDFSNDESLLVTGSFDATAQIWRINDGSPIFNFRCHSGPILSVIWTKSGKILTGGDDYVIHSWSESDCDEINPPAKSLKPSRPKNRRTKKTQPKKITPEVEKIDKIENGKTENEKNDSVPVPTEGTKSIESKANRKKKFAAISQLDHFSDAYELLKIQEALENPEQTVPDHLSFYVWPSQLPTIVGREMKNLETIGNSQNSTEISAWMGSFGHIVENGEISDYVVGLAAGSGHVVWKFVVEKYVEQLENDQNFSKASTYLLALGEIEKSVEMLLKGRLYREALVLCRLRLPTGHLLFDSILRQWAERAAMGGNLLQSAKCRLASKEPEEAVKYLLRKNNNLEHSMVGLEILVMTKSENKAMIDQLLDAILNPIIGFGRWKEVGTIVSGLKTQLQKEIRLFTIIHQFIAEKMREYDVSLYPDSDRLELEEPEILEEIRVIGETSTPESLSIILKSRKDLSALSHENDILQELTKIVLNAILMSEKVQIEIAEPWREIVYKILPV